MLSSPMSRKPLPHPCQGNEGSPTPHDTTGPRKRRRKPSLARAGRVPQGNEVPCRSTGRQVKINIFKDAPTRIRNARAQNIKIGERGTRGAGEGGEKDLLRLVF